MLVNYCASVHLPFVYSLEMTEEASQWSHFRFKGTRGTYPTQTTFKLFYFIEKAMRCDVVCAIKRSDFCC